MRFLSCSVLVCSLAGSGMAQVPDTNVVERSNRSYVVISGAKHTTTGNSYLFAPGVPPAFAPVLIGGTGLGVAANTHTWRWLFHASNYRANARSCSGFVYGVTPSGTRVWPA